MVPHRIRGRELQRIRRQVLEANPLCVRCLPKGYVTPATELDHIVPLYKGGLDSTSNVQPLCTRCHREKTAEDMGYTLKPERKRIGADGWPV